MLLVDSDEFGSLRSHCIGNDLVDEVHKFDPFILERYEG